MVLSRRGAIHARGAPSGPPKRAESDGDRPSSFAGVGGRDVRRRPVRQPPARPAWPRAEWRPWAIGDIEADIDSASRLAAAVPKAMSSRFWRRPSVSITQRLDQQSECLRRLASARVIKMIPWKRRAPISEDANQSAAGKVLLHLSLGQIGETQTSAGGGQDKRSVSEDKLAVDAHMQ